MNVIINGKTADVKASNLKEMAAELNLPEKGIAVAVDNAMVPRMEWESFTLKEGASIVIIKAACGG